MKAERKLPDFVIIGAQKSASTFLHEVLRLHPSIYLPVHEVRSFEDPEYLEEGIEELERILRDRPEPVLGVKRPDYLARPEVPARIRAHIPHARLIAVLREPVGRLLSAYYYYIKMGFLAPLHVNEGLARVLDGRTDSKRARELLEFGNYAGQIERYLEHFERDRLLLLLHEEMSFSPVETVARAYRFLGVREVGSLPAPRRDNSGIYSVPRLRWLIRRNRFLYDYDAAGKIVQKRSLTGTLAAAAVTAIDRYLLSRVYGNDKPQLDPGLSRQLREHYRPQVERLETLVGVRLDSWK